MASETITVKSTLKQGADGGWPVALAEKNEAHPDGEVFIADDKTHEVAYTAGVTQAITNGTLEIVGGDKKPPPPQTSTDGDKK